MGYHTYNSVAEYRAALDRAIDDTMENDMAYQAVLAMQDAIEEFVYDAYPDPEFNGRRMEAGGLIAKANLVPTYIPARKTLKIEALAPWRNMGFVKTTGTGTPKKDLSEVIEQSGMYGADPRPFAWAAEAQCERPQFAKDFQHGIIKRGF